LYTLGYRGDDLMNFKLSLNNPSKIAELQELEHWKTKFDIAGAATEGFFSRRWVADNIFGMSHEEFLRCQREQFYDRKHDTALESVAEAAGGGDAGGGGGGLDLGGDEGGGLDLDLGDEGSPAEEPAAGGDEGGEEESPLLAAPPGSRPSQRLAPSKEEKRARKGNVYTKSNWKGAKYQQVAVDKRPAGART
ncbi:MAG: portal protein, partial [Candidatus Thorarchaeota archaeon]